MKTFSEIGHHKHSLIQLDRTYIYIGKEDDIQKKNL